MFGTCTFSHILKVTLKYISKNIAFTDLGKQIYPISSPCFPWPVLYGPYDIGHDIVIYHILHRDHRTLMMKIGFDFFNDFKIEFSEKIILL